LHQVDLRDPAALDALPAEAGRDAIIHLAAKAGVRPSIQDPVAYQQTNVEGTQHLLEFARARGIKQFVFASSSSVYGVNPRVPWREDDAVLQPISPYASTKVSGELLGHVYAHLFGIRFLALRFFTVYGPRQRPDLAIHKFAKLLLAGQPLPFYGDGSTRRDYTYIDDIVAGIIGALHYTATPYEVINLGNNQTVSLAELVAALETAFGKKAVLDRQPDQPGDVPQTWADIGKAGRLLGYRPTTTLADGLTKFAAWLTALR
jgi:UDP-glucuronate 4-epimerase